MDLSIDRNLNKISHELVQISKKKCSSYDDANSCAQFLLRLVYFDADAIILCVFGPLSTSPQLFILDVFDKGFGR
jgi:hypothetical protein